MPRTYSANFKELTGSTSGQEPVYLLEITHPQLGSPIRVCKDTQDIVSNGHTFTAMAFHVNLPDDFDKQMPRAQLSIDNVGQELTQWLDASSGGRNAQVRIMQIMRNAPNTIEFDMTMTLMNVTQTLLEVQGELGFEDVLNLAGLPFTYRPENTPGLF